ncbi:MAG: PilZ domain-containing protein [Nitrospirae bacterium]|nr:PilZ domain-containing protein [Nitrospirota bacterium]
MIKQSDINKLHESNRTCLNLGQVMQIHIADAEIKIEASIIGIEIGNYIILKTNAGTQGYALSKDDTVFITFLYNGVFYSFKSNFIDVIKKPMDFIIVSYPAIIEEYNIREHKRIDCILPVQIIRGGSSCDGTIINISMGGCRLIVKDNQPKEAPSRVCKKFQVEELLLIHISLHHTNEELKIYGIVKNSAKESFDRYYGVEFRGLTDFEQQALNNYINTIERIEQDHYFLYTLHSILQISMDNIGFEEQLDRILSLLLSLPGLSLQSIGCIYIYDEATGMLTMKVSRGLNRELTKTCANVPSGECLCGLAISTKEVVFADCVDYRHTIGYPNMPAHGHYCVPILSRGKPLGVINMYVKEGFSRNQRAENYLASVANALAGLIERMMARTRLEELISQLQSTNAQLKLSQEQLVQSEKMRSLGQLVAGIAHEINNPLGFVSINTDNMVGFVGSLINLIENFSSFDIPGNANVELEKIKKDCDYDYLKVRIIKMLERSKVGLDRIKKIVLDLKTYSRMDESEILETDINESIAATLELLTHEFKDRITVVADYGEIPLIKCYSSQLNQVFMNILINSCQAIEGDGEIRIKTSVENEMLRIDMSDTGKGIPLEIRDRLFDPFFTTKPVGEGTGLGLSISLGIIKKHNGEITVDSAEGGGSTFTIRLPIGLGLDLPRN